MGIAEHARAEFLPVDAVRAGGSGKARLDRGDERAARPLQPVDLGIGVEDGHAFALEHRSEEHTSELQSLMRISYAVFCLQKQNTPKPTHNPLCRANTPSPMH